MPALPNLIEDLFFLKLNKGPVPIIEALGSGALRALELSLNLGIFESLDAGPLTSSEVAGKISADQRGTQVLLDTLKAFGYLAKKRDHYSNSRITSKWLLNSSPTNVGTWAVRLQRLQQQFWDEHFDEALRQGGPRFSIYEWFDKSPERWKIAQTAFMELAKNSAHQVAEKAKLTSSARRLLDVGGGHGLYSIEFCRRYPDLSATVFDALGALAIARENIAAENMGGRVTVQPGNFWNDNLGNGYDVALVFNVLHGYHADQNLILLRKVADALTPGGQIIIMDVLDGVPGRASKAMFAYFALTFFITQGGEIYTFSDISKWLRTAGFVEPRRIRLLSFFIPPLVLARKSP